MMIDKDDIREVLEQFFCNDNIDVDDFGKLDFENNTERVDKVVEQIYDAIIEPYNAVRY